MNTLITIALLAAGALGLAVLLGFVALCAAVGGAAGKFIGLMTTLQSTKEVPEPMPEKSHTTARHNTP